MSRAHLNFAICHVEHDRGRNIFFMTKKIRKRWERVYSAHVWGAHRCIFSKVHRVVYMNKHFGTASFFSLFRSQPLVIEIK